MELLKAFNFKLFTFFLIIFILLAIFLLFLIMRNKEIIKNKNIKNYKEIVKVNQNNNLVLKLGKLFKFLSLTIIIYFILLFILTAIVFIIFPFGVGEALAGNDVGNYDLFFKLYVYYLSIVKYIGIFMLIDFLIYLVRTIICNYLNYKVLKNNYEININKMNIKVLSSFVLIILLIGVYIVFRYEIAILGRSN